jgi:small subunit ribosomal protein S13
MVYLFESQLPEKKQIHLALNNIYGIGTKHSHLICKKLGFSTNLKINYLSEDQIYQIQKLCDSLNLLLSNDLKKIRLLTIKKLIFIKSYKGLRRKKGLPIRGQRTHTNARTSRKKII